MLNNKMYLILLLISFLGISTLSAQTDKLNVTGNGRIYGKLNLRDNILNILIGDVGTVSQQAGNNILIGRGLYENEKSGQIAIGFGVLADNVVGETNIGVGGSSLNSNFQGSYNVALGARGLYSNFSGNYNTALGYRAFYDGQFFSNSTALGARAVITTSNQIRLGDANIISIGGYATWTNLSDKRLKKNIKKDIPGLEFITQLHPVSYQLDMESIADWHKTPDSLRDFKSEAVKGNIRYSGFLAQEVEAAAQAMGYEFSGVDAPKNEGDRYGLRYSQFVVPLVKAVQELSEENQQLRRELKENNEALRSENEAIKKELAELRALIVNGTQTQSINLSPNNNKAATISQNSPNPFNGKTLINYFIPNDYSNATIQIANQFGKMVRAIEIQQKGAGQIELDASQLNSGNYFYSLIVDGKLIESKHMVLVQ